MRTWGPDLTISSSESGYLFSAFHPNQHRTKCLDSALAAHPACLPHATKMSVITSMSYSKESGKKGCNRMRFVDWHDALAFRCLSQRCSLCTCALISTLTVSIVVSSPWERIASRLTSTMQSTQSIGRGPCLSQMDVLKGHHSTSHGTVLRHFDHSSDLPHNRKKNTMFVVCRFCDLRRFQS